MNHNIGDWVELMPERFTYRKQRVYEIMNKYVNEEGFARYRLLGIDGFVNHDAIDYPTVEISDA